MKKIFTFVLGAFMALSASASTIFVEFTEDYVTFEKGCDEVYDWDAEGFVNEYFWDFHGHIDGAYDVRVSYRSKVEKLEGTYDVGDLQSLTELKDLHQNRTIWFESGTVTITRGEGDDDNLYVKCEIVGRDAQDYTTQDYVINLTYSPKAEGLPGDEDSDFLMNFASYTIDDELADEGTVYVEARDENRNYVVLEVNLPENATQLVAGTYDIVVVENEDYPYQSITAGSYQYEEPQASFASVLAEDGETIEKVWYIVSGKVFVKENMDIAIAANNSLGKRLAIVLHANSQAAVEMTGVATKAIKTIENGMIVIEHNGVRRNVIGQVVR